MRLGPISGHIDTDSDIDTDIGYTPISGHSVTDIVHSSCIPDIRVGVNIETNIGMPDIGNCIVTATVTTDIGVNIGYNIG
jgi:hypothetical protein